jgi:hypothetical protein
LHEIGWRFNLSAMPILLRRVLALLFVTAYMGAAMFQLAPASQAITGDMSRGMVHHDAPIDKMPCQGTTSPCVTDLGCIFLVGLPAIPDPTLLTVTAWSSVLYTGSPHTLLGRSIKPALGPPIPLA